MTELADMHCHIIPSVDDGCRDISQMKRMLEIAHAEGIRRIIATPHYHIGRMKAEAGTIRDRLIDIQKLIVADYSDMRLYQGQEVYYYSEAIEDVSKGLAATMAGSGYVLFEFSTSSQYDELRDCVYEAVAAGYKPILAHVERYMCLMSRADRIRELIEDGAYIQVNSGSVMGNSGRTAKRFIKELLKNRLIHFVATDAHNDSGRAPELKKAAQYISRKYGEDYCNRIFKDNIDSVLADEYID